MRPSKRSEPNGSGSRPSTDGRGTCSGNTSSKRAAVESGRSASDWGISDLRIGLHWQRNLRSRVVLPSKTGPHIYALGEEVYHSSRRGRRASTELTCQAASPSV